MAQTTPFLHAPPKSLQTILAPGFALGAGKISSFHTIHSPREHQLAEVLTHGWGDRFWSASFNDIAGILVDGTVYVDDEPYWTNRLEEYGTYKTVYVRRPFWKISPFAWLWDYFYNTPLVDECDVPPRSDAYTTSNALERLKSEGRISVLPKRERWWGISIEEEELCKARKMGRKTDYDRMRLLKPNKKVV